MHFHHGHKLLHKHESHTVFILGGNWTRRETLSDWKGTNLLLTSYNKFVSSNPAEGVGFFREKKSSARLPSEGK